MSLVLAIVRQWVRQPWPYLLAAGLATAGLLVLAGLVANDFTRVAVPGILTGVGTLALAAVTVWLSVRSEAFQSGLAASERHLDERQAEAAARERARAIVASSVRDRILPEDSETELIQVLNASREPIFDLRLIGARTGPNPETTSIRWLHGSGGGARAVLMAGDRQLLNGHWQEAAYPASDALSNAERGNAVISIAWTDLDGRHWRRDGWAVPTRLAQPWTWPTSEAPFDAGG